jgi:decaprenyl-phosphate phosphoribosyltransferase
MSGAELLDPPNASLIRGIVKEVRPKQWAKNVLVFIAPGAAGTLLHPVTLVRAVFAFCVFCMAAGGTYIINDLLDIEADRKHPKKRNRPIAAGIIPEPLAWALAAVFIVGAVALALWRNWQFSLIVLLYVILTTLYSTWMKHEPVLDLIGLASGFILRLLGGAYATEVSISSWFLIISCFGALFIATGKRMAEKMEMGDSAESSGVVLVAYCLFAVERAHEHPASAVWVELSIIPFLVAILRYAWLNDQGKGSAPEDVLLGDRQMQIFGVLWAILMAVSVYAH